MSTINLSVNMDRVQSSVNAAIRPALEEALGSIDVKGIIKQSLFEKVPQTDYMTYHLRSMYSNAPTSTRIEEMVKAGIEEIAKEFVAGELRKQRSDIEDAFRKMMTGSANRLVKAFGKATERALEEDWGFEIKVEVEHKKAERSSDDDC
jgi:BMFP domain-containing protein YqiC